MEHYEPLYINIKKNLVNLLETNRGISRSLNQELLEYLQGLEDYTNFQKLEIYNFDTPTELVCIELLIEESMLNLTDLCSNIISMLTNFSETERKLDEADLLIKIRPVIISLAKRKPQFKIFKGKEIDKLENNDNEHLFVWEAINRDLFKHLPQALAERLAFEKYLRKKYVKPIVLLHLKFINIYNELNHISKEVPDDSLATPDTLDAKAVQVPRTRSKTPKKATNAQLKELQKMIDEISILKIKHKNYVLKAEEKKTQEKIKQFNKHKQIILKELKESFKQRMKENKMEQKIIKYVDYEKQVKKQLQKEKLEKEREIKRLEKENNKNLKKQKSVAVKSPKKKQVSLSSNISKFVTKKEKRNIKTKNKNGCLFNPFTPHKLQFYSQNNPLNNSKVDNTNNKDKEDIITGNIFIQHFEDSHLPFTGKYTRSSRTIKRRNPFIKDKELINYEEDSNEGWSNGEGDDIDVISETDEENSEEEKSLDEFLQKENGEDEDDNNAKKKGKIHPFEVGPVFDYSKAEKKLKEYEKNTMGNFFVLELLKDEEKEEKEKEKEKIKKQTSRKRNVKKKNENNVTKTKKAKLAKNVGIETEITEDKPIKKVATRKRAAKPKKITKKTANLETTQNPYIEENLVIDITGEDKETQNPSQYSSTLKTVYVNDVSSIFSQNSPEKSNKTNQNDNK
eukprot:GAHX01001721.1.p1 GENE.GAHX01001721.1~~GAHX01001721.1.p1  ORF type:complete len:694 (-),score=221.82 GAHX01001721.1:25-2067(-)